MVLEADGITDAEVVRLMDLGARRKLMESLDVDAIIVARVDIGLEGFTIAGIGNKYPQAMVSFQVFNGAVENAIWYDRVADNKSTESVGKTRFFDDTLVTKYGFDSAKSAFLKIKPENTKVE